MPRAASPVVFPAPHARDNVENKALYDDPRYTCWYERSICHWTDHDLDWFYREQQIFQEKATGKFFWPHKGQMVEVTSMAETMSDYIFQVPADYQD